MKVTPQPEHVLDKMAEGFLYGLDDAVKYAQSVAPKVSGTYARSIQHTAPRADARGYSADIGATVSSARAKELGAYIVPKRAPHLVFDAGQGIRTVDAVRLPARPVVGRAVRRWPEIMRASFRRVLSQ